MPRGGRYFDIHEVFDVQLLQLANGRRAAIRLGPPNGNPREYRGSAQQRTHAQQPAASTRARDVLSVSVGALHPKEYMRCIPKSTWSLDSKLSRTVRFEHHGPQAEKPVKMAICEYRRSIIRRRAPSGPRSHFRQSGAVNFESPLRQFAHGRRGTWQVIYEPKVHRRQCFTQP